MWRHFLEVTCLETTPKLDQYTIYDNGMVMLNCECVVSVVSVGRRTHLYF